ncbi:MAG: TIGR02452 family protein [Oscillospiraceae bacterium]|nr:TIGR02452 family protein [Oscillospiraceae bacterium]
MRQRFMELVKENDRLYESGAFDGMKSVFFSDLKPIENPRGESFSVAENTVEMTTIACILENAGKKTIALNFASARHPGGGYLTGASAQEESLCRASGLYYTIKDVREYYEQNERHKLSDYTDGMIYSENVPVVRDDSGELLKTSVLCDFITCPAVNKGAARLTDSEVNAKMKQRIEKIITLAVSKAPDVVILGAFGCGVFRNRREDVLPLFEDAINSYGGDIEYIFAIP